MKKVRPVIFSAFASAILAAATLAAPATLHNVASDVQQGQSAQQLQSVSGTIASVDTNSFTLTVTSAPTPKAQSFAQDNTPKTMTFKTDKNTTVDGTLKVNSQADVSYRQDDSGNNIAVSVRVTPAQ
jgi:hypothetical protein